jgi:hypothetical protein
MKSVPPVAVGSDQGFGWSPGATDSHLSEPFPIYSEKSRSFQHAAELDARFAVQRDGDLLALCRPLHQFGKAVLGFSKREMRIAPVS